MFTCFDDSEGNLMLDQCQWKSYLLSFTCKGSTSKLESVCDQDIRFSARYSYSPRWTRTWYGLGLQLILDARAGLLRWFPRRRMSLGILGLFCTWLLHAPNLLGQVSQGWLTSHDDIVASDRNINTLLWWYWGGIRSISKLIKQVFHQVLIDLNRTLDGWVMVFLVKHCCTTDESNVGLWWACNPRSVLCIVYPCPIYCRGHRKRLSQVDIIIMVVPKYIETHHIK